MKWNSNPNLKLTKETYDNAKEMQTQFLRFELGEDDVKEISPSKLYQIAVVIGIRNGESSELNSDTQWFTTADNINKELFRTLLEVIHPELTEDKRVEMIQKYAEYGFEQMYKSYQKTDRIEYEQILNGFDESLVREVGKNYMD